MVKFNRPHTEIAEDYWNREYLDYSNKPFKNTKLCLRCAKNFVYNDGIYCEKCISEHKSLIEIAIDEWIKKESKNK